MLELNAAERQMAMNEVKIMCFLNYVLHVLGMNCDRWLTDLCRFFVYRMKVLSASIFFVCVIVSCLYHMCRFVYFCNMNYCVPIVQVKVLGMLSHPNIISYYDSFEEEGILWIEMEYADGGQVAAVECGV